MKNVVFTLVWRVANIFDGYGESIGRACMRDIDR